MHRAHFMLIGALTLTMLSVGCADDVSDAQPTPDASTADAGVEPRRDAAGEAVLRAERADPELARRDTVATLVDCSNDCDGDGLDDCEEQRYGTAQCRADTDRDGLDDAEEIAIGSDPLDEDTDNDGAMDGEEVELNLDPKQRSTFGDGVDDGMRWILDACDELSTERIHFRTHYRADWKLGLSSTFDHYEQIPLNRRWVSDFAGVALYGDSGTEATGLIASRRAQTGTPQQTVETALQRLLGFLQIDEPESRTDLVQFETHDGHMAASQTFVFALDSAQRPDLLRRSLLNWQFRGYQIASVPPYIGSPAYDRLRVGVTSVHRTVAGQLPQAITNILIMPESSFETGRHIRRQFAETLDTTNLAARDRTTRLGCERFAANESPKTDFYWVIDQSRSMEDDWQSVVDFATQFFDLISTSGLDYRLGVTTMDRQFLGGLDQDAPWHTDRETFLGEIDEIVQDPYSPNGEFHDDDEYGLQMAREGLTYMLGLEGNVPNDAERIREDARVATIFVADEDPESFQQYPLNSSAGQRLLGDYSEFFGEHSTVYALTTGNAWGYRQLAIETSGSYANMHGSSQAATNAVESWVTRSIAEASTYQLRETPITSSMMVFKNGRWVPRSLENGYAYFPQTNSIVFFGRYRPEPGDGVQGDHVAIHYRTFGQPRK